MKKSLFVLTLVLISATLVLAACPSGQVSQGTVQTVVAVATEAAPAVAAVASEVAPVVEQVATQAAPVVEQAATQVAAAVGDVAQCTACTDPKGCVIVAKDDPIRIAWLQVVSGANASLGTDEIRGIELAIDARATVAGHAVELVGEDEQCSAEGGQIAATKISSDPKVVAAVGTTCSSAARAAIPLMYAAGIPMVSASNTAPDLTAADRPEEYAWFARTAHNDLVQGAAMAQYATEQGYKNAATIHDGSLYADQLQQVFAEEFQKLGGAVVRQEATTEGTTDMGPMLTLIAAAKPDFIYLPIFIAEGAQVVSQAKQNSDLAEVALAGADGVFSPDFLAAAGDAAVGFLWSSPDFAAFGDAYQDFLARHEAKYGEAPLAPYHAHAYDAFNVIASAIEKAAVQCPDGSTVLPRTAVRDAIFATADLQGLTGALTCSATGDCGAKVMAIYEGMSADPASWSPGADETSNPKRIWPN